MATGNVGNLNVKLTLSAEQFGAALSAAGGDVNKFAMQVQNARASTQSLSAATTSTTAVASKFSRIAQTAAPAVTQLGYAAQDAISQLGTRGLGGAIQSAANNIAMLGAAGGPKALAVTAAISAGMSALGMYIEHLERAKKATKELADPNLIRLDALAPAALAPIRLSREIGKARSVSEISALRESRTEQLAEFRRLDAVMRNELTNPQQRMDAAMEKQGRINRAERFAGLPETQDAGLQAAIAQAKREIDDINQRRKAIADQSEKVQREVDQIDRSGAMKAAAIKERAAEQEARRLEIKQRRDSILQQYETPFDKYRREQGALQEALKSGVINQQEFDRANSMLSGSLSSGPAPGVGAFDARTSQGWSQLQESIRSAMSRNAKEGNKPEQETAKNTGDMVRGIRKVEDRLRNIKVANIA